ncbi:MAG: S9 family peptidase [Candidatus Didemnitutus sp.]|nr:S9 family peptidase [Candidatus Didemnitutus sp.]
MKLSQCLVLALCLNGIRLIGGVPAPVPELPVAAFFQSPAISSLVFSPNGKYVLCVVPHERRQNLAVIDLEKGTKNLLTNFKNRQVVSPQWASDDRILYRVDDDGQESFALYAVNRDGSDPSILASGYSKYGTTEELNVRFSGLLRRPRQDPQNYLVTARINNNDWNDVARLNLKTSRLSVVVPAPGNVVSYVLDHADEVRFAVVLDSTQTYRVLYRDRIGQEWTELTSYHRDEQGWMPLAFDGDNRTVFIASDVGRPTSALHRFDTTTRLIDPEPVWADETFDVGTAVSIYFDRSRMKTVGFSYPGERPVFHWIDPEFAAIDARLNASLPDTAHVPLQISEDGSRVIYYSYSDRDPGVYYLYDRKRQKLTELAVVQPSIDPAEMAPMRPVSYVARDGLKLHGYLTLPVGRPAKNLPLIVHPHGGPYGPRDSWSFVSEVQFYANRGFAVLQVNFRGSGGYGRSFEAAGYKRWGLEMQDDLTDGVKWAIGEGIADPARVVISGASYGGYAAMAGLVYTPDLYRAGINYVGVVNIANLIPKAVAAHRTYWHRTRLGDLSDSEDRKRLRDTSPVNFADRIRVPVLMAYGKNDPRVTIDQGYDIERALKKSGVPYEFFIEEDEGHGFRREEKRIAFYERIDAFLKQHVPAAGAN